ncbi:hypothetical protein DES53_106143 [Roseimicrobium gellanilyticum]|uniref:Uncharacterized protein n=1 Tax=Roseimicrobium gellanilyticum TaxID=748857 RepID=A0A366HI58_9BACT|nr:hypothetical protein [Roseimicrobium gellanilyticum]RBP42436.1 hypothetical protein DES53_106143 [Roseimicrobium gellanilyticum]
MSSAQGPQYPGTHHKFGEEARFRENTVAQTPLPTRHRMFTKPLPAGRVLELAPAPPPPRPRHPFYVRRYRLRHNRNIIQVAPGTINGIYPTLEGIPISEEPHLEVDLFDCWVYLKLKFSLLVVHDHVNNATLTSATIVTDAQINQPYGPNNTGEYYILLAVFKNYQLVGQTTVTNLVGEVTGIPDGSARGRLEVNAVVSVV